MTRFARIVLGYHGCDDDFANGVINGDVSIAEWRESNNEYDWLGRGIYFWEHAPNRARAWGKGGVIGAVIQLGNCLDFGDIEYMNAIADHFAGLRESFERRGHPMPTNHGVGGKLRELDAMIINSFTEYMERANGTVFQTVRSPFIEGTPVFEGSGIMRESHTQVTVRDTNIILGVFRPNIL